MKKSFGGTHTTLTETTKPVVGVLTNLPAVKNISPGVIRQNRNRGGLRFVTAVFTNAGLELIVSGESTQKVAVHTSPADAPLVYEYLKSHKRLSHFIFRTRERKPGL